MTLGSEVSDIVVEPDLRPNSVILAVGCAAIAFLSAASLPWPLAIASILLGSLMIAGADVDARTCLLPDIVTVGAAASGVIAAALLDPYQPGPAAAAAIARACGSALALLLVRFGYARIRGREGIGLGDVKLAAGVGAWLPIDAIPTCFGLATASALVALAFAHLRGRDIEASMKVPFGAFLCPALWLVFYANALFG